MNLVPLEQEGIWEKLTLCKHTHTEFYNSDFNNFHTTNNDDAQQNLQRYKLFKDLKLFCTLIAIPLLGGGGGGVMCGGAG